MTLRNEAERLEAEAALLETSCATLETENENIEAAMRLRLGDAHVGAPRQAPTHCSARLCLPGLSAWLMLIDAASSCRCKAVQLNSVKSVAS